MPAFAGAVLARYNYYGALRRRLNGAGSDGEQAAMSPDIARSI